jgi:hypothetical protein
MPRDTSRMTALLRKARVVDDDHSTRISQRRRQQPAIRAQHRLLVPWTLIDELLQRLHGVAVPTRHVHPLCQWLDTLAFAIQHQPLQIDASPVSADDQSEVGHELGGVLVQPRDNLRIQLHHHRAGHVATLQLDRKLPVAHLTSRTRHGYLTPTK